MIIKNIDDIKKFLPLNSGFVFKNVEPYLLRAEKEYLIPEIGQELYELLNDAYNDTETPLTAGRLFDLLPYAQAIVVNFGIKDFIPVGNIQISDKGIKIHTEESLKPAPLWAKEELSETLSNAAFADLEALKLFLDERQDLYIEWATSTAYERAKDLLINYASEFSEIYNIANSNRTFVRLKSILKNVQEDIIQNTIGEEYYTELTEKIFDEDLNPDDKKILRKIKKALVFHTIVEAAKILPVQITEYGFSVKSYTGNLINKKIEAADDSQMQRFIDATNAKALEYIEEIRKFLNANASTIKYPTYFASSTYSAPGAEYKRDDNAENTKIFNMFT